MEKAPEPPPWQDAYDENGVDRSLIRQSLAKTPTERLRAWQSFVDIVRSAKRVSGPGEASEGSHRGTHCKT